MFSNKRGRLSLPSKEMKPPSGAHMMLTIDLLASLGWNRDRKVQRMER